MWYPPKACSSGAVGLSGHCLEHFCRLAYQSKTGMSRNSQLTWCQMLVALAFVCKQMDNDEYKLVAPLVPLSISKRPCFTPSCHSIPHFPADSTPSTGTSNKTPGNWYLSSGSRRCSPE
ncbi:hypothetical protein DSO57_1012957 [Entomophthora muscae]|uniref:Uncharacterized protein n=1 Tax=Entomophthora muscae TaxID=34485 RepID=A0ACC2TH57_9FUNG|nr:hypothetical protein DSO57_1012957 [Entomophthora muscae]